jgi:hypothetical protein
VHIVGELNTQIAAMEAELTSAFEQHADAEIVASLPGLGPVLALERWPSLATIPIATAMRRHARPMPKQLRSRALRVHARLCSREWRATATLSMHASVGRTRR